MLQNLYTYQDVTMFCNTPWYLSPDTYRTATIALPRGVLSLTWHSKQETKRMPLTLHPHSTQPRYKPIELTKKQAENLKVVAEFVAVIG